MINMAVRGDSGNVVASTKAGVKWKSGFAELDPDDPDFLLHPGRDPSYGEYGFSHPTHA